MIVINPYAFTGFSTQYQAVLARATAIGATKPSPTQQILDDILMRALVSSGVFAQLDTFYWHANDGDRNFAKINWINPGTYDQTEVSTVTWTASYGFQGNGSTGVLNWNFAATNGVKYQRDNSSFGAYINQGFASSSIEALIGAFGQVFLGEISGPVFGRIQNGTGISFGTGTDFIAGNTYAVVRTGASATNYLINGASVATGADASVANASQTFYTFGNNVGFVQFPLNSTVQVGATWAGSGSVDQSALHTAMRARMMGNITLGSYYSSYTQNKITLGAQTDLQAYGDSITVGTGASDAAHRYINLLAAAKGLVLTNLGSSGRGAWMAASSCQGSTVNSSRLVTCMVGLNDIRRGGSATKTLAKIEAGFRTLAVKSIRQSTQDASGSSAVTRTGTFAGFAASSMGGLFASGTLPGSFASSSSTIGDNWQWSFTGTGFCLQFIANSGDTETYGQVDIYIDGAVVKTVDLNIWYDNISDGTYDNRRGPLAFSFHGLTSGAHTVKVQVKTAGIVPLDFFAPINVPASAAPVLFAEIPYISPAGYAGTPSSGSIAASNAASDVIKSVVEEYRALGYSFAFVKTNTYYNIYAGLSSDNVHPTDTGHAAIETAFLAAIN